MEHHVAAVFGEGIQPFDNAALVIASGIALRGHNDGDSVIIGPVHAGLVQAPFGGGMHQVKNLRAKTHHQDLTLRVAKTGVVFDQTGGTVLDHQTGIKHPLVRRAALGHFGHGRADDFCQRTFGDLVGQHRRGRIGPHAAGVGAGIAVADAFVVLGSADRQHGVAVTQNKEGRFFAVHKLLDHHLCARVAEGTVEHRIDGGQRFGIGFGDDHAFARCKAVGLDHDRGRVVGQIGPRRVCVGEMPIGGSGGVCGVADLFRKGFGGFQRRGRF